MFKAKHFTYLLLLLVALFSGLIIGRRVAPERGGSNEELHKMLREYAIPNNKITATLSMIEREYIDKIYLDSLSDEVIPTILEQLDPHSSYIPAKDMQRVNEPLDGEFEGVGIVFNMATDTVIVLNVIPSGPSDMAGVMGGDRIINIDGTDVAGQSIAQDSVVRMLRGPRGSKVKLSLERIGLDELLQVEVTRDVIPLKSIETAFILSDKVGYMRMSQFARTTHEELTSGIDSLLRSGMQSLILDLRGNSGGYLDQAISIANEFLPKNKLIVYTEDRSKQQMREYSDGRGRYSKLELAVLIDEGSASSSEILAGALQDNDRGVIIGRRSFGKGLVQRQVPFADGSAIRLTIARYFTPTGRSIQKPYRKGDGKDYEQEIYNRYLHNELFSADSITFDDSLRFTTPGGKVVYGGGGIMPDIFVAADTTAVSDYYLDVSRRNILYRYTIEYADKHRNELRKATSIDELKQIFGSDEKLVEEFVAHAQRKGVAPNREQIKLSHSLLAAQLKAYIARNSPLAEIGYYAFIYPEDVVMLRALQEIGCK
ncbi:MAG: S41 family peptidase [Rikenellaceae bacterium]